MDKLNLSTKNIVAATDFSSGCELAVLRAAHIAQQHQMTLHLIHVANPLDLYPELMLSFDTHVKDYERLKRANGTDLLDELASTIRNDFNIIVKTSSQIGKPHVQIAEYAQNESASLVVVGFHDEKNVLDVLLGSTAFKLLRLSPCPVLIVRNKVVVDYKEVIAAVDLSEISTALSELAANIAPTAHIEIVHVFDLKQEVISREIGISNDSVLAYRQAALKHIRDELNQIEIALNTNRVSSKVVNGYLPTSIYDCANEVYADLVVLGNKNKSSLEEFLLGNPSKAILNRLDCDVLLM